MLTDSPISNADYVFNEISVVFKFLFGTFRPGTTSSLLHHKTGTVDQTQCVSSMEQSVVWRVKCVTVVQSDREGQGSHRCLSAGRLALPANEVYALSTSISSVCDCYCD